MRRVAAEIMTKLGPEALDLHAGAIVAQLAEDEIDTRISAISLLARVRGPALTPHSSALIDVLEDKDAGMREGAVEMLCRNPSTLIVPHVDAIAAKLAHADGKTRHAALEVLSKEKSVLKSRLSDVVGRLDDHEAYVRLFAAQRLEPLSPHELRPFAPALKKRLYDYDVNVRKIAQGLLAKLGQL